MESKRALRVILVEDSADDADLLLMELRRCGFDAAPVRVESAEELRGALIAGPWDLVLSDHVLPRFSSTQVLAMLKELEPELPCIIVSGVIGEETAVAAMRNGAADYLLKDNLARLGPAIERELREAERHREYRRAEELFNYVSQHDELTDLPNRARFREDLERWLASDRGSRRTPAVMFLDMDRLTHVNDTLGLAAGDQILRTVADRLRATVRSADTVARWGGDQFALLFPDLDRAEDAARVARKVLAAVEQPMYVGGQELFVTASVGISFYPNDGQDADTLLRNADAAKCRAKDGGRGEYQFYTRAMNARAFERLALESSLRRALEKDQFALYYQPQVDAITGAIVGFEALIRWQHPDMGMVYPAHFIPLAEELGLIVDIGQWVLRTACMQNKAWQDEGLAPVRVAVNLSARQFRHQELVQSIVGVLGESGLNPDYLELEITEGAALQYANFTATMMRDLRALGIQISIDDFGTGYSSLSTLSRFRFDKLKIDQSFVHNIGTEPDATTIALSMIVLAKSLHRRVIAEGVETPEQLEVLRAHGCDEIQGYLTGRPMPAEDAAQLLRGQPCIRLDPEQFVLPTGAIGRVA